MDYVFEIKFYKNFCYVIIYSATSIQQPFSVRRDKTGCCMEMSVVEVKM